jgi:hypothetical protein
MKNFNFRIFIISSLVIGLLVVISLMIEWDVEENGRTGLFEIIVGKSNWIFTFPICILFWMLDGKMFSAIFILVGLIFNTSLLSILIERFFYFRKKKKSKIPPVPNEL